MAASAAAVKSRLGPWRGVIGGLAIECGVMRNLMILAAVLVGLGTYMAQVADKMSRRLHPPAHRRKKRPRKRSHKPQAAASTFPATPAAISRPTAASTVSASIS